jgi:MOSC domain-containing protein YiiM
MTKALGRGRGGICVKVLESGLLRTGDPIEVI